MARDVLIKIWERQGRSIDVINSGLVERGYAPLTNSVQRKRKTREPKEDPKGRLLTFRISEELYLKLMKFIRKDGANPTGHSRSKFLRMAIEESLTKWIKENPRNEPSYYLKYGII